LLYSLTLFQICNGDIDGPTVLSELDDCFEKVFGEKQDSSHASSDVLVEVLLAFASKPSALLRKVSQQVFTAFASDIKASGLRLLFNVGLSTSFVSLALS
jgi:DNA polymerase phi